MRKWIVPILVTVIASACSIIEAGQSPITNVDTQATIDAVVRVAQAQTQVAQPTPTVIPSSTITSTPVVVSSSTVGSTPTSSFTPAPNLTTTPATATNSQTSGTTATTTSTLAATSGSPTVTPTLGILKYGTLPPAIPWANIKIFNKSQAQAYISLQNDAIGRPDTVLEYPVKKEVHTKAPLGYYTYVVWVGGKQIVGDFVLNDGDDLMITIYKDTVEVH